MEDTHLIRPDLRQIRGAAVEFISEAFRYPARSIGDIRGQGPVSKAERAAATARSISASLASATLR